MSFRTLTVPSSSSLSISIFIFLLLFVGPTLARNSHVINFRSPDLFPESFVWDPKGQHFIVGSLRHPTLLSVSDAGVAETLLSEPSLPSNSSFLGLAVDRRRHRLLAVVHLRDSSAPSNALASFDLNSRQLLFLTPLVDATHNPITTTTSAAVDGGENQYSQTKFTDSVDDTNNPIITTVTSAAGTSLDDGGAPNTETQFTAAVANDVAVDYSGNAYVTSSVGDFIWKVNVDGEASVFSRSPVFKSHPVDRTLWYHACGLNGVVYNPKGYLLVVQSNTGKLYKVNVDDGTARTVILSKDLTGADGIAVRNDGVVVVVNQEKVFFIKSDDSWSQGVVFDETALEVEKQASAVTVGDEDRVYVLYGYVNEGMMGNVKREEFSIVEVESEKENKDENVWVFVLIGLGLAYFAFWRFQMRQLMQNMDKKTA